MPSGIYPRTKEMRSKIRENLAKGRTPAARGRSAESLREMAKDPEWRKRVSEATKAAMHRPEVRARHLEAMKGAKLNFKGGNGQVPAKIVREAALILEPLGYIREYTIKTKGRLRAFHPLTITRRISLIRR